MSGERPNLVITRCVLALLAGLWIGRGAARIDGAWQDLPSEAELPGRNLTLDELPPESVLPGTAWRSPTAETPPPRVDDSLPSEAELPTATPSMRAGVEGEVSPQPDADLLAEFEMVALESEPAEPDRPWLRLLLNGPTAPLRALQFTADSQRLLAGGDDKSLHVWRFVTADADLPATWTYEQPIAWQVQRGARGSLGAIAADAQSIFFAGVGATPLTGEIARVEPQPLRWDRCLYDLDRGSMSEVTSLAIGRPGTLAALDLSGQVVVWQRQADTGLWQAERIRESDVKNSGAGARADALTRFRRLGSALAGSGQGVLCFAEPIPASDPKQPPQWRIVRRELAGGREALLAAPQPHAGGVPALAVSADGQRIVSADLTDAGRWFRWDLARRPDPTVTQIQAPIRTLAISRSGRYLLIGTARNAAGESQATLLRWDAGGQLQPLATWKHRAHVLASCFSPDETWLAYTQDATVVVRPLASPTDAPVRLAAAGSYTAAVAFSADPEAPYRVRLSPPRRAADEVDARTAWIFDPQNPGLVDAAPDQPNRWLPANPQPERWQLRAVSIPQSGDVQWQVQVDGRPNCQLPLDSNADGVVTASVWLADPQQPQQPLGLVVGTNKTHHIYLFRLPAEGPAVLVRQYRGHESAIESLSVSTDRRYLVSAAADSTVRFWKMDDAAQARPLDREDDGGTIDAWGARFRVENQQLAAVDVVPDGPLYFRGLRAGDQITAVAWTPRGGTLQRREQPAEILTELRSPEQRRMLRFEFARRGVAQSPFYLHPAWQPLASLLVTDDREWAYWSPYGYYDASFNGHKRFGWQFNRGIDQPPDLFRAAEMKESLERPELLRQLLSQGSMAGAFQALHKPAPDQLQSRLASENRLRPRIVLLAPRPGDEIAEGPLEIRAQIECPRGIALAAPKAFLNGVPAGRGVQLATREEADRQIYEVRWVADPPADRRLRIQVLAASKLGGADVASCDVIRSGAAIRDRAPPRLFLLAAGVNEYADGQIPKLEFAVHNVQAFRQALAIPGTPGADLKSTLLLGPNVSRTLWRVATELTVAQLQQQARPDDLVVIFLSGHGVSDPATGEYFFVTPAARYADLMGRQYRDCIALDEFSPLAQIPCRKLVILDTCESGTFQDARQQNLKPLVRWLENDLFFTLTSAEGAADAYESAEAQLSYFTASLIRGLQGAADLPDANGEPDGRIEWRELARYVMLDVPAQIARIGKQQYPSAAPRELLEFAEIPLR